MSDIAVMLEREAGASEKVSAVLVGFGLIPVLDKTETERLGRPFYVDREYVKILAPGDKTTVFMQPATDAYRKRFPQAYAAFKAGQSESVIGTPLEHWPMVTRSQAMNFRAFGVATVEALANVHDGNLDVLGREGRELREKARAYLKQAEDTAAVQKLAAEKLAMTNQMAAMQAQIAELAQRLEAATGDKQPGDKPTARRKPALVEAAQAQA
jgi:hypothetical protein